jgi:hypothetical protein
LSIAVDSAGSAYLAGVTASDQTTFPELVGPDLTLSGTQDAFVTKVKADGTGRLYCGYIGGASFDQARAIAVDSGGNAYIAGETRSSQTSFPVTVGPDQIFNGGLDDAFVVKISGKPDLFVLLADTSANVVKPGDSINAFDRVGNQALGTAPVSTTRYYLSLNSVRDAGDILLGGNHSTPILLPGNQILGFATVTVPTSTPLGTYRLLACADDTKATAELDETNNCLALSARTLQVTRPDLQAVPLDNPPTTATAGQTIQVQDNTFNEGLVAAAASTTRFYLSVDSVKGAGDILLTGSRSVAALAAGSNSNGVTTVVIPSSTAPNTYRLLPCADDLNAVIETIEANNCRASVGTVVVSAQVGGFELDPRFATVVVGEPLSYRFQWIHPVVWRDLTNLQLRFADQADGRVIFRVLWDETSNTFRLVDENGIPTGRAELPGSNTTLQNRNAILRLAQTTVVPDGPTSGFVTLTLARTF